MPANLTEQSKHKQRYLAIGVGLVSLFLLVTLQLTMKQPIILASRFSAMAGWFEIVCLVIYATFIGYKMYPPKATPVWRVRIWTIFSIVFFTQLALGLLGFDKFLMTGKLHFPIPAMIVAGPVYRGELSVMTIIFLSTLVLTGPAWCSQFCYFGAFDAVASKGKTQKHEIVNKSSIRHTTLLIVVVVALTFRWLGISGLIPSLAIVLFAIIGIGLMLFISRRKRKMVHCITWCPVGTVVQYLKYISPFRMKLNNQCTSCIACTPSCKYDALTPADIANGKPGASCTLCGDCVTTCHGGVLHYSFPGLSPRHARWLYLLMTISLHVLFLATARI